MNAPETEPLILRDLRFGPIEERRAALDARRAFIVRERDQTGATFGVIAKKVQTHLKLRCTNRQAWEIYQRHIEPPGQRSFDLRKGRLAGKALETFLDRPGIRRIRLDRTEIQAVVLEYRRYVAERATPPVPRRARLDYGPLFRGIMRTDGTSVTSETNGGKHRNGVEIR